MQPPYPNLMSIGDNLACTSCNAAMLITAAASLIRRAIGGEGWLGGCIRTRPDANGTVTPYIPSVQQIHFLTLRLFEKPEAHMVACAIAIPLCLHVLDKISAGFGRS